MVLQKKMNELYAGKAKTSLPPIQIQPPSMGSVLDMLNVINGILFVQISQQDIEAFRSENAEKEKKALAAAAAANSSSSTDEKSVPASDVIAALESSSAAATEAKG